MSTVYIHSECSSDEGILLLSYFKLASRLSLGVRVYTRPVTVLGSTLVKMSLKGMLRMSGLCGYLNDCEGPLGCRKLTLTSSFTSV